MLLFKEVFYYVWIWLWERKHHLDLASVVLLRQ